MGYLQDLQARNMARIDGISPRPASKECGSDRWGISKACEQGMRPDRRGISEPASEELTGKNYVWLNPSVRVRRQPTISRCSREGKMSNLIRSRKAVTIAMSSPPSATPSATTAPVQMDHMSVGPEVSHAPASSDH
ncbi:hypothetical protein L3X38_036869 [Prunus dulcis]|uniref:Uncharacterized protein n=1 Tax=Prunus dulcis TaxID=3755 RepID=A0AAD4V4C3_PRUDU|nr:hypothetical protein L3X38_036869 [Prunus dulcis]